MKGYCVDVRGFSPEKKKLVSDTIEDILGYEGSRVELETTERDKNLNYITSVDILGNITDFSLLKDYVTTKELQFETTFNDLMSEAEYDYVEDGVYGFKEVGKHNSQGFCVNVTGFSAEKRKLVADAIDDLCGYKGSRMNLETIEDYKSDNYYTNVHSTGTISNYCRLHRYVTPKQLQHEITFEKLRTLHLGWDMLEDTEQPDKNEPKEISASRAIAMFYSKEEEIAEVKNKVEELEEECKKLEDELSEWKTAYKELITLKIDRITELEKELSEHKKLSFTMTLVAIVCFPLAVLLF